LIVRPLLVTWRQLREQIAVFDKAVQQQVRVDPICRLLMTVPGIGALSSLMYVSTVEDPGRFSRSLERWVRTSASRHAATNQARPIAADTSPGAAMASHARLCTKQRL